MFKVSTMIVPEKQKYYYAEQARTGDWGRVLSFGKLGTIVELDFVPTRQLADAIAMDWNIKGREL